MTTRTRSPRAGGTGEPAFNGHSARDESAVLRANVVIVTALLLAAAIAAVLLIRTMSVAQRIDAKAANIAKSGRGINLSTDSIIQLSRTNALALSILRSARPLDGQLTDVVARARSIDGSATAIDDKAATIAASGLRIDDSAGAISSSAIAIDGSASTINSRAQEINETARAISATARAIGGTAGLISSTARGINGGAGAILAVARLIDRDAAAINRNLDATIGLAGSIKVDTGDILGQARSAKDTAACIHHKLPGGSGGDAADCHGTP